MHDILLTKVCDIIYQQEAMSTSNTFTWRSMLTSLYILFMYLFIYTIFNEEYTLTFSHGYLIYIGVPPIYSSIFISRKPRGQLQSDFIRSFIINMTFSLMFFFLSCGCYAFLCVCLYVPCGHLLGRGWPLGSRVWCLTVSLSLSHWYPGPGVALACIDS